MIEYLPLSHERKKELKRFVSSLNIRFKNWSLLNLALSHKSYLNEERISKFNNEKLEFLGDSVLGFIITSFLYKTFPDSTEGRLAKIKSFVVSEKVLSKIALLIKLDEYILIGKGEESTGGRRKKAILADTFEAFLGSLYLDIGNVSKMENFVINLFKDEIYLVVENKHEKDYKTLLQELSQKKFKVCPVYVLNKNSGPEHMKIFYMEVKINNKVMGEGEGHSKKEAEQKAAENAFLKLTSKNVVVTKTKKNKFINYNRNSKNKKFKNKNNNNKRK